VDILSALTPHILAHLSKWLTPDTANWALVLVGIITFFAIWYQAKETANAAKATLKSVEAFWLSQRPQIAANAHGNPIQDLLSDTPRVQIELHNKGMTTAYDCNYESWIEVLPGPSDDFTIAADYFKQANNFALYPNHKPVIVNLPIRRGLTAQETADLKKLRLTVGLRVRLEFRDARTTGRYANFGFYVAYDGLVHLPRYNDSN